MASEGWTGGPCTFDPASGLQNLPCPHNLLSTFSGPGIYNATGSTSHPNSTFVPVAQVPEDLTTVTVAGQQPGGWINTSTPSITLSSQPPALAGTNLPGLAAFVASPIQSITYGISPANSVPIPGAPASTDTVVENSIPCPSPANPPDPPAAPFTTDSQTLNESSRTATIWFTTSPEDCAGTEELQFSQDAGGSWSTSYYTYPINVDTMAPVVATGPVLSPSAGSSGSYSVGQAVTATYSCTDERSGVIRCGSKTFSGTVLNTGAITSPVDTSTPGSKTYTVTVVDAAGNQSSASVNYVVAPSVRYGDQTDTERDDSYLSSGNECHHQCCADEWPCSHRRGTPLRRDDPSSDVEVAREWRCLSLHPGIGSGRASVERCVCGRCIQSWRHFRSGNAHGEARASQSHRGLLECQLPVWGGLSLRRLCQLHCWCAARRYHLSI